jgi:cytochrome c oxidase subunit II
MRDGFFRLARRSILPGAFVLLAACSGDYPQTMTQPVSEWGQIQIDIWAIVTWWTVPILFIVFGVLAYIVVRFRARPDSPRPKPVYGSTRLEIIWTVIPALIVLAIAIPTIQAIFALQEREPEDALVIEAIGHQWWWEFRYPEEGIITANQFYVPVGRPISFRLRSNDVIHSFWIPRLGGKRDVNPVTRTPEGVRPLHLNTIVLTVDSTGEYLGQCAEFCGTQHAIMRMMAVAVEQEQYDTWVSAMQAPLEPAGELATEGHDIFMRSTCIACHAISGTRAQGRLGPDLSLMGDRFSIGAGLMANTEENMTEWILRAPELKKGIGMPGAQVEAGGMPATMLSRDDARAIAAYLADLRLPLLGAAPPAGPGVAPDAGPGTGPDAGPGTGPDAGPASPADSELAPDALPPAEQEMEEPTAATPAGR